MLSYIEQDGSELHAPEKGPRYSMNILWLGHSPYGNGGYNSQRLCRGTNFICSTFIDWSITAMQDIIWKAYCHSACQKISCFLMKPEGLSPYSQNPDIGSFREPAESSSPHRSLSV